MKRQCETGRAIVEDGRPLPAYLARYLPDPCRLRVELLGLNDATHAAEVSFSALAPAGAVSRAA
ncbi:MAG: hypothetical protein ACJ8F7_02930 [Gemmataceae bacterium]